MGKHKGFNEYKIDGEIAIIYIYRRNGALVETIVDAEDIPMLKELNARWCVQWIDYLQNYYVMSCYWYGEPGNRKMKRLTLQRAIMGVDGNRRIHVDHINHDQLDNRKSNLRVTCVSENSQNRKGANRNNKSGYRNVSYINGKWYVQLQVEGKNKVLGKFEDVHEAGKYAEQMRSSVYGAYAGDG